MSAPRRPLRRFSPAEVAYLREHWGRRPGGEIARELGRSHGACCVKAAALGLAGACVAQPEPSEVPPPSVPVTPLQAYEPYSNEARLVAGLRAAVDALAAAGVVDRGTAAELVALIARGRIAGLRFDFRSICAADLRSAASSSTGVSDAGL